MPPMTRLGSFYISVYDSLSPTRLVNPDTVVLMASSISNRYFCYVMIDSPTLYILIIAHKGYLSTFFRNFSHKKRATGESRPFILYNLNKIMQILPDQNQLKLLLPHLLRLERQMNLQHKLHHLG